MRRAREQIFADAPGKRKLDCEQGSTLGALAEASDGFSGAEIEQAIVVRAVRRARRRRPLSTTRRCCAEISGTRPLSVLMAEQVNALREWAARAPCRRTDRTPRR